MGHLRLIVAMAALGVACSAGSPPPDAGTDAMIQLPADEAPHSEEMEWWYYTGRLSAGAGEVYGFELTIFQAMIGDKPLYVGHFAITNVKAKAFYSEMNADAEDQRDAVAQGFALKVGMMEMSGHGGKDTIRAKMTGGHGIDLQLTAQKPVVLQYGNGVMTIGSDKPYYYYSYTRMAAAGTITIAGIQKPVTGLAWMDHQWGTIGSGYGWDWFSLRLDDESEVMLFEVRRTGKTSFIGGTTIDKSGKAEELKASDFTTTPLAKWTSPHTNITYPHGWRVNIPSLRLIAELKPVVADQEFNHNFMDSPIYWEGLCGVTGTQHGSNITGHAYVEITGNWK